MRVGIDAHVLTGFAQGTATVWRNLLPALPSCHTYVLYSFDPEATRAELPQAHFEHRRIPVHPPHIRIPFVYPWLARRDGCQVFHVNYFGPPVGAPGLVVTCHNVLFLDFPALAPLRRRLQMRVLCGMSVAVARQVITDSEYSKARIARHFRVDAGRITVIYPPIDASWSRPDETALGKEWSACRARLPERYVLGVGRLEPRKHLVETARVVSRLVAEGLTDGLVWVGADDFGTPEIERALRAEGLAELVVRLRGVSTIMLQAIYRHAQALAFLSIAEGFGYPPLEAMAIGTPVICSNRTSLPEVVGDAAIVIDPDDRRAAVDSLRSVITKPEQRATLIAAGRIRASGFSAREAAARTAAVYARADATTRGRSSPGPL